MRFKNLFRNKKMHYGYETFAIPYKKIQKIGIMLFVFSLVVPMTVAPITCPLIWKFMIK